MLRSMLAHPLTRGVDLNNPRSTFLRRRIIQEKPFLRQIYEEWYGALAQSLPGGSDPVLEIGSGGGFLHDFISNLITSEIFPCPGTQVVLNATRLPFRDNALRGIVMTGVLPHLPHPRSFFSEAARCVRAGGVIAMVEPWVSAWSRKIYGWQRQNTFSPDTPDWELGASGLKQAANRALPWIIFERDRRRFEQQFPEWRIQSVSPFMPFRYLVSGGVSLRTFAPELAFSFIQRLEGRLESQMNNWAMFARIVLIRNFITEKDIDFEPAAKDMRGNVTS